MDAQLPQSLASWLRTEFGVTATHLEELHLLRAEDSAVFEAARQAADILITKDEDFAHLVERHGPPPRILWLRCGNVSNARLREIVLAAWSEAVQLLARGEALVEIGRR